MSLAIVVISMCQDSDIAEFLQSLQTDSRSQLLFTDGRVRVQRSLHTTLYLANQVFDEIAYDLDTDYQLRKQQNLSRRRGHSVCTLFQISL